jgi:hypothetical protein
MNFNQIYNSQPFSRIDADTDADTDANQIK